MFQIVKGEPFGFLKIQSVAKYQQNRRGDPLVQSKYSKKVSVPKKKGKGGPFSLVLFYKCTKKFLAEAGTRTCDRLKSVLTSGTYRLSSEV